MLYYPDVLGLERHAETQVEVDGALGGSSAGGLEDLGGHVHFAAGQQAGEFHLGFAQQHVPQQAPMPYLEEKLLALTEKYKRFLPFHLEFADILIT